MTEIQSLQAEIEAIETELVKLRTERSQLEQPSLAPVGGPEQIATVAKAAAVSLAERQPQLQGIRDAIALLESQLPSLRAELAAQQKQDNKDALKARRSELEPKLLEVAHKINNLSSQMDAECAQYRELALQYNRVVSELKREQVFPVSLTVSGLPCATTITGRQFNLNLGMRKMGTALAFEQQPQPYVPSPNYSTAPPIETRIALQQSFVAHIRAALDQVPAWDRDRIATYSNQIAEAERQIKKLEQQQEEAA